MAGPGAALHLTKVAQEPLPNDTVEAVAFSPDGKRLAMGAGDGVVAVYPLLSTSPAETVQVQKLHAGFTSSLAWSPHGKRMLSAGADGSVRIWDPATMRVARSWNAYPATHPAAVWSPDGTKIAVAEGRDLIRLYDALSGAATGSFKLAGTTRALLWLPDGQLAGSDDKGRVVFFRPSHTAPIHVYQPAASHKAVNSLSLSPTQPLLAVGYDDGSIVLLDPATAKVVRRLPKGRSVGNVAWSPNGHVLAVSSIAFDVTLLSPLGRRLARLNIGYDMNGLSWSPDGRYLAAGSDDHTLKVWRVSPAQGQPGIRPTPPDYMGR